MNDILRISAVILLAVAITPALAHALELPGKMRLKREAYDSVQRIYYPGFTVAGGIGEAGGLVLTAILLFRTPTGTPEFWLTLVALLGLAAMQAVYWLVTHPINNFWLAGEELNRFSSGFFSFGAARGREEGRRPPDWTELRDRWEYSHVARAALSGAGFIALVISLAR